MAVELAGLLVLNAGYAAAGLMLLALLRAPVWSRAGVALPLGLAALVLPSSYLALAQVPVGWTAGLVWAAIMVAGTVRFRLWSKLPALPRMTRRAPGAGGLAALAVAGVTAVVLLYAARTFAIRPLIEWDGFAIWMAKARLLYTEPSLAPAALRSGNYGQTPYPLALPTLEALGFGAMGRYDGTLIGVQFILLAASFPLALWSLLRSRAHALVVALAGLAVVGAPQILYQLLTKYADVPLGLVAGLGLAAGGAWLAGERERWLLVCFAGFLGLAGVMKSEGFLFALAAAVVLPATVALARDGRALRPALAATAGVLVLIVPWRVYCSVYGLTTADYNLNKVVDVSYLHAHSDRVHPVASELWRQATDSSKWGVLTWAILLALVAAVAAGRWLLAAFAAGWLALSAAGLVILYWASNLGLSSNLTNTSYRTIVSLLIGGAALVPLLVFPRRVGA